MEAGPHNSPELANTGVAGIGTLIEHIVAIGRRLAPTSPQVRVRSTIRSHSSLNRKFAS